jgi:hypothetical protein
MLLNAPFYLLPERKWSEKAKGAEEQNFRRENKKRRHERFLFVPGGQ